MKTFKESFLKPSGYKKTAETQFESLFRNPIKHIGSATKPFDNFNHQYEYTGKIMLTTFIVYPFLVLIHSVQLICGVPIALWNLFTDIKSTPEALKGMWYFVLTMGLDLMNWMTSVVYIFVKTIATMIYGYGKNKIEHNDLHTEEDDTLIETNLNDEDIRQTDSMDNKSPHSNFEHKGDDDSVDLSIYSMK